jgi:hypothetical protein
MARITRSLGFVLGIALVVAFSAAVLRVATNWSLAPAGPAPAIAHGDGTKDDPSELAANAFAEMGYRCFEAADFDVRPADPKWIEPLQELAIKAGGPGHWIDARTHAGWIGERADAVAALNGEEMALDTKSSVPPWVKSTESGKPVAYSLREVVLPNGWSVWYPDDYVRAVSCPDAET